MIKYIMRGDATVSFKQSRKYDQTKTKLQVSISFACAKASFHSAIFYHKKRWLPLAIYKAAEATVPMGGGRSLGFTCTNMFGQLVLLCKLDKGVQNPDCVVM